jgi:FkbM family methyltransferase
MTKQKKVGPVTLRLLRWFGHRHWIKKGRDRVIRIFANPDNIEATSFEVDFFGLRYRGNLQSFIDWSVYFYGCWARNELLLLKAITLAARDRAASEFNAVDVGANVGNHSLFLSTVCDRVFAFEPYEAVRRELDDRIAYNETTNITVFPVALGENDEELEYSVAPGVNSGEGSFVGEDGIKISLPVRHGDTFFCRNCLPRIDLLKIDVEGFEGFVLRGLQETIWRDRPIILCELSDVARRNIGSHESFRGLIPPNYLIVEVGTASISGPYQLRQFSYDGSREFLAIPEEFANSVVRRVPELRHLDE